jgi:Domain of unknown function (DUF2017)
VKVRRRGALIRLRFDGIEPVLLYNLFDDLVEVLRDGGSDLEQDPVQQRLFPSAYRDDDAAEDEFRSLTEESLRTERSDRARQCRSDVAGEPAELQLSDEDGQRWIQVLNDLRLTLGTELDVTEDAEPGVDVADPQAQQWAVYYWLTGAQDSIVRALMR